MWRLVDLSDTDCPTARMSTLPRAVHRLLTRDQELTQEVVQGQAEAARRHASGTCSLRLPYCLPSWLTD